MKKQRSQLFFTYGLKSGHFNEAILVAFLPNWLHNYRTMLFSFFNQIVNVVHRKRDVFDAITVLRQGVAYFFVVRVESRFKYEYDFILSNGMAHNIAFARF